MRIDTRILPLVLICVGLCSLPAPAQRRGQVLESRAAEPNTTQQGNTLQAMQAPVLGFVYGAERGALRPVLRNPSISVLGLHGELRPILGIPGASVFGGPLAVPVGVTSVQFAPGQNYALLPERTGDSIGLMTFQGAVEGPLIAISGGISQPDIISFSPSGNAAALYSKAEGQLQVITGLPNSPAVARIIPRNNLPDEVRYLAVADDEVTLLEGTAHSEIYLLPAGGSPQFLHGVGDLEGLAFVPGSSDVVAFDRDAGTAFLLQEVNSASAYLVLAEGLSGGGGNVFLQVNRGSAIIASTNSSNLWRVDLQSLQVQNIRLPGLPQMLQPLRTSGNYLLFYQPGQPAWILDSHGEAGAVSFVPASTLPDPRRKPVPLARSANSRVGITE